jgi:sigma-B regulation protein RsbU (phosphoserine phosphatase)
MAIPLADVHNRREASVVYRREVRCGTGAGVLSDVFPSAGKRTNIVLVNVHGLASGVEEYARYLRHVVRTLADLHAPGSLVECLNLALNRRATDDGNDYVSGVFFGALHNGSLTYASGGHEFALIVHANGRHRHLPPTGKMLGITVAQRYKETSIAVSPGDWLFLATDGILRAQDARGASFGEGAFVQSVRSAIMAGVDDPAACIIAAARTFVRDGSVEDASVLCVRFS